MCAHYERSYPEHTMQEDAVISNDKKEFLNVRKTSIIVQCP